MSRLFIWLVRRSENHWRRLMNIFTWRFWLDFCWRSSFGRSDRFFLNFFFRSCSSFEPLISGNSPPSGSLSESLELKPRKGFFSMKKFHWTKNLEASWSIIVSWHRVKISKQLETELISSIDSLNCSWSRTSKFLYQIDRRKGFTRVKRR